MPLSLQSRDVGDITVVKCSGRIVEGTECAALKEHVNAHISRYPYVVLNLAGVQFLDSAGLGLLARLLTTARAARGDVKLCGVPAKVAEVLRITNLGGIFESYQTEADAIAAFFRASTPSAPAYRSSPDILCVETSADVLAYLRHLLGQDGLAVTSVDNVPDALILLKVARPKVVIMSAALRATSDTHAAQAFNTLASSAWIIELPAGFARDDAGKAGTELLERLRALRSGFGTTSTV